MKRFLLLLTAASVITTLGAPTRAHAAELGYTHVVPLPCAPNCAPDLYSEGVSASQPHVRPAPTARPTVSLAVLLCMTVTGLGTMVSLARFRKHRSSSEAREAQLLADLAIQAALARKRVSGAAPAVARSQSERKPQPSDCYFTYQARQVC